MWTRLKSDQWLGLCVILLAVLLVFVWVPLDVETGIVETVRRRVIIGDSLAPVIAGAVIALGGVFALLRPAPDAPTLNACHLRWLALLLGVIAISFVVMRFAGPLVTEMLSDQPYRALRATAPWNYIGYVAGGTVLVAALISIVKGRITASAFLIGVIASALIALGYDLPFDDLQLPPNGDV